MAESSIRPRNPLRAEFGECRDADVARRNEGTWWYYRATDLADGLFRAARRGTDGA